MRLRVHFPAPGFFLNESRLRVRVDGRVLYDGSFNHGFDVSLEVPPGPHVLSTFIGPSERYARTQEIELPLGSGGYRDVPAVAVRLHYSRLTGNFKKRASLSTHRR